MYFVIPNVFFDVVDYEAKILSALRNLRGLKVYTKESLPEEYHYKHSRNVMAIQLEADMHYIIAQKGNGTAVDDTSCPTTHNIHGMNVPAQRTTTCECSFVLSRAASP